MARSVANLILDAALDALADNGTRLDVCSTEPTTYAEATSTFSLANTTLTAGAGNGDWGAIADGGSDGRAMQLAAQTGLTGTADGTPAHVAITDGVSTLLYVLTASGADVSNGGNVDTAAATITFRDPTAP